MYGEEIVGKLPGHARQRHEDKVSDTCDAATENAAALLESFFETVRYVYDKCADDIQKYCARTEFGGRRIFSCLIEKSSELTGACKEVTAEFSGGLG